METTGPETRRNESLQLAVDNKYHSFKAYAVGKPGVYTLKFSVKEGDNDETEVWTVVGESGRGARGCRGRGGQAQKGGVDFGD